jgi:threonine aldolase
MTWSGSSEACLRSWGTPGAADAVARPGGPRSKLGPVLPPTGKSFGSDNHAGVHPAVLAAMTAANDGDAPAYGADDLTRRATDMICGASGAAEALLVFNGTAANIVGISLLLRPFEAVICAESSHLNTDECGAAERILGCKLLTVDAPDGKLTPDLIATRLGGRGDEHRAQPRVVELAQLTEVGTCYSLAELQAIRDFCHAHGLRIYLDGARLANAAAHLNCSLSDLAACADVLSFGGTKNGAAGVEAVLIMSEGLGDGAVFQRKQLMQLGSKMRFLSAQIVGLLEDGVWLANARQANAMARRLAAAIEGLPSVSLAYPMEGNGVFARLPHQLAIQLQRDWNFHIWSADLGGDCVVRWMTAFDTSEADVDALAAAVRAASR